MNSPIGPTVLSLALGIGANRALSPMVEQLRGRSVHRPVRSDDLQRGSAPSASCSAWAPCCETAVDGRSPSDPLTIGGAVALIAVVTAMAGGLPARHASNT